MSDPNRVVISGPGNLAYRLEIHDFVKNKQLFTLYIRALQSLEAVKEGDDKSFFAVGGIHGLPYAIWNQAQGSFVPDENPDWTFGGYCTHGTVVFPTWHRPYVMLYEQLLQSLAAKVATQFTVNKDAWTQAASQLRQPYWDWAQYALPPDEVIRSATVTITDYNGRDVSVPNPLLRYKFQAKLPLGYFEGTDYADWQTTLRHPDSRGRENINAMVSILNSGHNKTRTDTVLLLTNVRDWDGFSNHSSTENSITNSLESIHDNIHTQIGGNGHMGDPAVAGFDPIFYLHHCNVDRLISLWSAVHPGVWVTPGAGPQTGTFNLPPDARVDTNTDLSPFWNSPTSATFWKSSQVVDTTRLGYSYADFKGIDLNNPSAVRAKVVQIIRQYMQPSSSVSPQVGLQDTPPAEAQAQATPTVFTALAAKQQPIAARSLAKAGAPAPSAPHTTSTPHGHTSESNTISNWTVRVRAKHHELGRSYSVLVFLGNVPEDPAQYFSSPNLVGAEYCFANSAARACANCSSQDQTVTEGFVHLNDFIAEHHPELGSFNDDVIKPYLKEHLSWKVLDTAGQPVEVKSLEVTVFAFPISWDTEADFPIAGDIHYHHGITRGRVGGMPAEA